MRHHLTSTRRQFLAASAAAPALWSGPFGSWRQSTSPNEKIALGVIGIGWLLVSLTLVGYDTVMRRYPHDAEDDAQDDVAKDDAKDDAEMDLDAEERKSWRDAKDEQNKSERRTAVRERRSSDDATSERAKKRYDLLVASGMTLVPSGMEGFDISTTGWVYAGFHEVGRVTDVSSGRGRGWYGYCTRHTACKVWADVSHCDNPRQLILTWLKDGMTIANKVAHQSCWSEMYRPAAVP